MILDHGACRSRLPPQLSPSIQLATDAPCLPLSYCLLLHHRHPSPSRTPAPLYRVRPGSSSTDSPPRRADPSGVLKRSEEKSYVQDDAFTLQCTITVLKDLPVHTFPAATVLLLVRLFSPTSCRRTRVSSLPATPASGLRMTAAAGSLLLHGLSEATSLELIASTTQGRFCQMQS